MHRGLWVQKNKGQPLIVDNKFLYTPSLNNSILINFLNVIQQVCQQYYLGLQYDHSE